MKISVKVKAGAKADNIDKISENEYAVSVKTKPQDGKANYAVREILSGHLGISKSRILLVKGKTSKNKLFEIL